MWLNNILFHFYFSGFPHAYRPPISFYKAGTTGKLRRMHCALIYLCIYFDIYLLLSSLAEAWLLGLNVSGITTEKKKKTERNIDFFSPQSLDFFLAVVALNFIFFTGFTGQYLSGHAICVQNDCLIKVMVKFSVLYHFCTQFCSKFWSFFPVPVHSAKRLSLSVKRRHPLHMPSHFLLGTTLCVCVRVRLSAPCSVMV